MGSILSSRRQDAAGRRVLVELSIADQELLRLQGEINDVYLFSERVADVPSRVSLRGKNDATRYFLIPRQLRKNLAIRGKVSCQRIDSEGKTIFVYVVDPTATGSYLSAG
ncbi:TPA: hypothetical protein HA251_02675 [Candidatus Woesearchaeota archaeon]|nr:hypothetical protein [Candidatus Woesearchaeota archaeon]